MTKLAQGDHVMQVGSARVAGRGTSVLRAWRYTPMAPARIELAEAMCDCEIV
jgi:hypothetical protein